MRKAVPVGELQYGMYVAELDRPWTDTPFRFQGFVLETPEQLETLKKFCHFVHVDPDRAEVVSRLGQNAPGGARPVVDLSRTRKVKYIELAPVEQEFGRAVKVRVASEEVIEETLVALRAGKTLDAERVSEAVAGITESVLRNPDAMLLYTKLRQKGDYTQSHALDTSVYMAAFGRFLEMSREDISMLGHLGLLQDIGKVRLPNALLEKRERLTPEEFELATKHVDYSAEILSDTPGLPRGLPALALLHHERHDGSGYPRKLRGKDIGLMGSIAAIVDTFDALTARRPYAEPVAPSAALSMLYKWRSTFFDPYLVEQFIRCIGIFPIGSIVELNSGETGIVIAQNLEKRLQPRVMVVHDAAGNALKPQKLIDLSRGLKLASGEQYRIKRTLEYGRIPISAESLFL
ncbi:MAG TPA: HD-GYP domain-containing protein [Burkholderiales bacterium]|nr:HD-GYP domain-containing protein [Burkholderiales bacterium]